MQRPIVLWFLLVLIVGSETAQEAKRKVNPKTVREDFDHDDEVDDESGVFSTYADNRYAPTDSFTTAPRTRATTPAPIEILEDTDDHLERARFMAASGDRQSFSSGPTCYSLVDMNHPLLADMCGVLPQARYTLPNLFGHRERWQIELFLHGLMSATTDPTCLRSLRLLLCPLLLPPCPSRFDTTTPTSLPCQSFCRVAKAQCSIPALDFLPCEVLPMASDLCPTNQFYGAFFPPGPTVRSQPADPIQMPMQDVSSWSHYNSGKYAHDQPTSHQLHRSNNFVNAQGESFWNEQQ